MDQSPTTKRVLLVVNRNTDTGLFADMLSEHDLQSMIFTDPEDALNRCRQGAPDLVIVQDSVNGMRVVDFLSALLRISWTTSTIVISQEDEDTVHEKTEGLGILGSVGGCDDVDGLARLLEDFLEISRKSAK